MFTAGGEEKRASFPLLNVAAEAEFDLLLLNKWVQVHR
jgi:hypothetical protein